MQAQPLQAQPLQAQPLPSTHWSLIQQVRLEKPDGPRPVLDVLLRRYLPALRSHLLLRRRLSLDEAEDVLQGFISSKVLEAHLIERADRAKGKFRTLLLTALDRYTIDQQRSDAVQKRTFFKRCENHPPAVAAAESTDSFDIAWGRQVLAEAMRRMRQECESAHRNDLWRIFEDRILRPALGGQPSLDYRQLAKVCGFKSPVQAGNAVITCRRMLRRILREVVAEYAHSDDEIDEEIHDLRKILGGGA